MTAEEIKSKKIISSSDIYKCKNYPKENRVVFLDDYLDVCKEKVMVPIIENKMEYTTSGRVSDNRMQGVV